MTFTALTGAHIFDGEQWLQDHALLLAGERIEALIPSDQVPEGCTRVALDGLRLAPGLIDTQVNGGGGVLLNDQTTVEAICTIGDAHRALGTTSFLPTLISDDLAVVKSAIDAVDQAISANVPGVLGVHLEGPFLNPARKGVHNDAVFRQIDDDAIALLTSLKQGVTYVTLAPERTTPERIAQLAGAGVIVAAGHTAADYAQTRQALDAGLKAFTHLFNAMTPMTSREPGVVGAALEDEHSWCGIIVDKYHVDPATLRVALKAKARGKMILVTDAMPTVGAAEKRFVLNGETIVAEHGRCATANGTLAGSDLDMIGAVKNTHELLCVELGEALRMASAYPAAMLGLDHTLGYLRPGYQADLIAFDARFHVSHSWIKGQLRSFPAQ